MSHSLKNMMTGHDKDSRILRIRWVEMDAAWWKNVENSKIDGGAVPLTVGSRRVKREDTVWKSMAPSVAKKQASSRRSISRAVAEERLDETEASFHHSRPEVTPVGKRGNCFFFWKNTARHISYLITSLSLVRAFSRCSRCDNFRWKIEHKGNTWIRNYRNAMQFINFVFAIISLTWYEKFCLIEKKLRRAIRYNNIS